MEYKWAAQMEQWLVDQKVDLMGRKKAGQWVDQMEQWLVGQKEQWLVVRKVVQMEHNWVDQMGQWLVDQMAD